MRTEIIFEDSDVLVIYKPAGLPVQSAKVTQTDVFSELKAYCKGGYIGLVHRLDQPVEGLLVIAKTKQAAAELTRQLASGELKKKYYALVLCETQAKKEDTLTDYLSVDQKAKVARVVHKEDADAKKAVLKYNCIKRKAVAQMEQSSLALMDIEIGTGRFHQIRVQMAHAGLPLLGDLKYGSEQSKSLSNKMGIQSVALCAYYLSFSHPKTEEKLEFRIVPRGSASL